MLTMNQLLAFGDMFVGTDDELSTEYLYPDVSKFADGLSLGESDWNYSLLNLVPNEFIFSDVTTPVPPVSMKHLIQYHDCMWSGRCTTHPEKYHLNQYGNNIKTKSEQIVRRATLTVTPQQHHVQTQTKKILQGSIQAGQSLLINSRLNQPKASAAKLQSLVQTCEFLKDRDCRDLIVRPDTPLSLDDEPHEFKHTSDVSACTTGSNRLRLVSGNETPSQIINLLREQLEGGGNIKLNAMLPQGGRAESLTDFLKDMETLSDYEDMDGEESIGEVESDTDSNGNTSVSVDYSQTTHSDHSYTRSKNRVEIIGLGVQTPSDSEEEIDVVSVGEKAVPTNTNSTALPTNPTAKDRKVLQTTVAHKISNRIVKTSSGVRTIPPRRRYSSDNSTKTTTVQQFASHSYAKYADSGAGPSNRKRPHSTQRDDRNGSNKRQRGKKQQPQPQPQQPQRTPINKRATSDTDETETIEKRNLHNNMERQRRIGLKNLFEELKKQIPALKDKDRAPKVNILREAEKLCLRFKKEDEEADALRKLQEKLYSRVSVLRTSLASQRIA